MPWSYDAAKAAIDSFALSSVSRQVAAHWLSLWADDEPPRRARFDPEALKTAAPGIAIFDVRPGLSVICRYAGPAYKFRFGLDITGKDWLELTEPGQRELRLERNTQIALGAVAASRRCDPNREADVSWFGDIQLPFSGVADDGTRSYLHHSDWRPLPAELRVRRQRVAGPMIADEFRAVSIRSQPSAIPATDRAIAGTEPKFNGQHVLVIDDDALIREVLTLHLETAGLKVTSLDSARPLLDRRLDREADCIVSDVRMPDIDGLELQEELNQRESSIPFVVLTAHGDIPLAVRAMRAGAVDVLEKPFRPRVLLATIARALELGGNAAHREKSRSRERLALLSSREKEVFELIAQGKPSRDIAGTLGVSLRTVDGHRANVMHKLNARTMAELVRIAVAAG